MSPSPHRAYPCRSGRYSPQSHELQPIAYESSAFLASDSPPPLLPELVPLTPTFDLLNHGSSPVRISGPPSARRSSSSVAAIVVEHHPPPPSSARPSASQVHLPLPTNLHSPSHPHYCLAQSCSNSPQSFEPFSHSSSTGTESSLAQLLPSSDPDHHQPQQNQGQQRLALLRPLPRPPQPSFLTTTSHRSDSFSALPSPLSWSPSPSSPLMATANTSTTYLPPHPHHDHPQDHLCENLLAQYTPPPARLNVFCPHPSSMLSSMDETKTGPPDESTITKNFHPFKESFQKNLGSSQPKTVGSSTQRHRLLRGYRRLGFIAAAGLLFIGAAIALVIFVRRLRSHHISDLTGGTEGDIRSQSGLGSARNHTLDGDGADPFNITSVVPGPDNGLRGGINGYDSLVVFGASFCDNAHARPASLSASLKPPPYFKGRWTNGYVWDEYLSQMIGPGGGRTTLVNYAYGSATVDNDLDTAAVPDVESQIAAFVSDLNIQSPGAGPSNGKSLIGVWVGINSVTKIWNTILRDEVKARTQIEAQDSMIKAQAHINATVDRIFSVVDSLIHSAAFRAAPPDLLMLPIPPAQLLLVNIRSAKGNIGALHSLSTLNDLFNIRFSEQLRHFQANVPADQRVFTLDIPTVWRRFVEQPQSSGLTIVDQPCLSKAGVCSTPNSYLYWDTLHPTTYIHQLLATMLRDVIRS